MEAIIYYEQLGIASDAADLQHEQIRQQQVSLRLQQNQNEIVRMTQLRQILAQEQVTFGVRNIAPESGTIKAITEQNFQAFIMDENADKLNFMGKQQALNIQDKMVDVQKRAQYLSATAGFIHSMENIAGAVMGAGAGGGVGGAGASGGAMMGAGGYGGYGGEGGYYNYNMFDGYNMNLNR